MIVMPPYRPPILNCLRPRLSKEQASGHNDVPLFEPSVAILLPKCAAGRLQISQFTVAADHSWQSWRFAKSLASNNQSGQEERTTVSKFCHRSFLRHFFGGEGFL